MFKSYYLTGIAISWCINRHNYAAIMDYDFSKNVIFVYFCNDINHLIPKELLINAFPWQILNPLKVLIVLIHLKVSILKYKIYLKVLTFGSILKYYVISQEGPQLHTFYCNDNINYYGCYVFKFFLFLLFSFYVTWSGRNNLIDFRQINRDFPILQTLFLTKKNMSPFITWNKDIFLSVWS